MQQSLAKTVDRDIRVALREFVRHEHADVPDTVFLEEFALYAGETRADLATLNGSFHGYEIKSARDTLERLPRQVDAYNAVFERATLVGAECHLAEARPVVPTWWGIIRARSTEAGISLTRLRQSRPNPAPKPQAVAALLWKQEALEILTFLGLATGMRSKPMADLIEQLAAAVTPERLSELVRQAIRARGDWRAAARQKLCGGTFLRHANWWRFRRTPYGNRHR